MIRILPESSGSVVGVQASEMLTDSDYKDVWIPAMLKAIEEHGSCRALIYFDETFKGWEPQAMADDAEFGFAHLGDFDKLAMVGGPEWVRWGAKFFSHLMKCEVRCFEKDALQEAWAWIR